MPSGLMAQVTEEIHDRKGIPASTSAMQAPFKAQDNIYVVSKKRKHGVGVCVRAKMYV